jgi:hypothetical protein
MHRYALAGKSALQFEEKFYCLQWLLTSNIFGIFDSPIPFPVTLRRYAYKYTDSFHGPITFLIKIKIDFYSNP